MPPGSRARAAGQARLSAADNRNAAGCPKLPSRRKLCPELSRTPQTERASSGTNRHHGRFPARLIIRRSLVRVQPTHGTLLAKCVEQFACPVAAFGDEFYGNLAVERDRVQQLVVAQGNRVLGKPHYGPACRRGS